MADDEQPATKRELCTAVNGLQAATDELRSTTDELRATTSGLQATTSGLQATTDELRAKTDELSVKLTAIDKKLDVFILEMRSERTGVQQSGTVIPEGTVVIESGSFFAHASRAIARHKGQHCVKITIVSRSRNAKKYM